VSSREETAHLVNATSLALGCNLTCRNSAQVAQMLRFIDWWWNARP
jgi:hypothetical protein